MIASLHGKLETMNSDSAVVNVNGIGFHVYMPTSTLSILGNTGQEVYLLTHLVMREDSMTLYGFGTEGELELTPLNGPTLIYPGGREELPTHSNIHFPCVKNFVDAVLDGAPLLSSGETAILTDWVTQKAVESAAPSA